MSVTSWPMTLTLIKDGYVAKINSATEPSIHDPLIMDQFNLFRGVLNQYDAFFANGWKFSDGSSFSFSPYQSILYINNIKGNVFVSNIRDNMSPILAYDGDFVTVEHQLYYDYLHESYHHLWRIKTDSAPIWYRFDSHWETIQWNETLTKTILFFKVEGTVAETQFPIAIEYSSDDPYTTYLSNYVLSCNLKGSTGELTIIRDSEGIQTHPGLVIAPVTGLGLTDKEIVAASINSVVSDYKDAIDTKIDNLNKIYQR